MSDERNIFLEGGNAFIRFYNGGPYAKVPKNPYPFGSTEYEQWSTGFEDASANMHSID